MDWWLGGWIGGWRVLLVNLTSFTGCFCCHGAAVVVVAPDEDRRLLHRRVCGRPQHLRRMRFNSPTPLHSGMEKLKFTTCLTPLMRNLFFPSNTTTLFDPSHAKPVFSSHINTLCDPSHVTPAFFIKNQHFGRPLSWQTCFFIKNKPYTLNPKP